jgi:ATPase subunit of ABC transporter with duplicated ATPase domains
MKFAYFVLACSLSGYAYAAEYICQSKGKTIIQELPCADGSVIKYSNTAPPESAEIQGYRKQLKQNSERAFLEMRHREYEKEQLRRQRIQAAAAKEEARKAAEARARQAAAADMMRWLAEEQARNRPPPRPRTMTCSGSHGSYQCVEN